MLSIVLTQACLPRIIDLMLGGYFAHGEYTRSDTSWMKDSRLTVVVLGYLIPVCILVVVVTNLVLGKVVLPAERTSGDLMEGLLQTYSDAWRIGGTIMIKLGIAGACYAWYAVANHVRMERWALVSLLSSVITAILGLVVLSIGSFV